MTMEARFLPDKITEQDFREVLARYSATVPHKIQDLDQARLHDIPDAVRSRLAARDRSGKDDGEVSIITREEALKLVDWKLSHGTFRPRLKSLVLSNPSLSDTITAILAPLSAETITEPSTLSTAVKDLTVLRGVGPATASLFLSTAFPEDVPFFGDEVYRWLLFEGGDPAKNGGWERQIKYTAKEYADLVGRVAKVRARLPGVKAVEVECVGYVLGMEAKFGRKVEAEEQTPAPKRKRKTAADEGKRLHEEAATRRSKRVKD